MFSCLFLPIVLLTALTYWFLTKTFHHWEKKNVPSLRSPLPGFGHILPIITFKENIATFFHRLYKMSDTSMTGFYFLRKPALLIRDPALVKCILQSNFSSFRNNMIILNEKTDPVLSKNPFFANNSQAWKDARVRVANHLSNKKLNYLFIIVNDVTCKMTDFIAKKIAQNGGSAYECELKKQFSRYTGEVVANSAFAVNGQSFDDNPSKFAFINVINSLFEVSFINGIKQTLMFYIPEVANFFKMSFLQKSTDTYFRENLKAIIKKRKQENSAPNDFLQFCMESNPEDDLDGIISDVIVFYLDVYETSSIVISILFYHLSQNIGIQQKLRNHINSTLEETDGTITFDSLKNMDYLECVIFESIRLLSPLGVLIKSCTKEITLTGTDDLTCQLRPGDLVFISMMGLHSDSKHWSEPHIFDPERFSKENEANRNKYAFLGFSEGPRMCAGIRFAIMLVKLVTATLISKYSIEHSEKTVTPIKLVTSSFMTYAQGGLWAKFTKLNKTNSNDA
jgi:cytochrome P450 family 6